MNFENSPRTRIPYFLFLNERRLDIVVHLYLRVRLEGGNFSWRPSGMHLAYSFLNFKPDINLLSSVQFDNRDADFFLLVNLRFKLYRDDWLSGFHVVFIHGIHRLDVQRGDFAHTFVLILAYVLVMNLQPELDFACLAVIASLSRTVTFPWVFVMVYALTIERHQSNALGQELIMKHGGIFIDGDQMWRHRWNFCNQRSSESIGQADIAVVECELDSFGTDFYDFAFNSRHFSDLLQMTLNIDKLKQQKIRLNKYIKLFEPFASICNWTSIIACTGWMKTRSFRFSYTFSLKLKNSSFASLDCTSPALTSYHVYIFLESASI